MRRSSRQPRGGNASTADALPPHVADGLRVFVRSCPSRVAAMVDASPGSSPDALADKLAGVMAVNSLSAESMLARFFDGDALASHLASDLGKSGKGNPATLAARIVAQWKPGRGTPAGNPPARKEKKRKNEEDEDEDEEGASARGGVEKDAADAGAEKKADELREPPPPPPPPKKRFQHEHKS